jgi:1-deoxyxylulose-5-phosphate synthase
MVEHRSSTREPLRDDAAPLVLAWVIQRPGVTAPIIGASKLEQLDQLIDGLSVTLGPDENHFLEEKYLPHPVLGH